MKETIAYLYNQIKDGKHTEWGEVSEILYLLIIGQRAAYTLLSAVRNNLWNTVSNQFMICNSGQSGHLHFNEK